MRYTFFALLFLLMACNAGSNYSDFDLMSNGLPIKIKAPETAVVNVEEIGGIFKDVTVKDGDDYYVQITSSPAVETDAAKNKEELLKDLQNKPYFSKIIQDDEDGFIYEKKLGDKISYDFRHVRIQGDKEYIFQTGLVGSFTEDQVRNMYEAVQ